jgi:hypothetical protein
MFIIRVHDIVSSQVVRGDVEKISPALSYKTFFYRWSKSRGRKIRQDYVKSMITKKGYFPTGLLPRVRSFLKKKGIEYKVVGRAEILLPDLEPKLKGIKFRDDQLALIEAFTKKGRGVVLSPTGTGKTVVVGAIFS